MADNSWSIKRDLKKTSNITDNQERENFYYSFYVHEGFISALSLLNDLIYSIVLFLKTQDLIVIAKIVFLNKQTNICWFKYKLRGFYDFTLRNIAIGQYHIYTENRWKKNNAFSPPKNEAFLYSKNDI